METTMNPQKDGIFPEEVVVEILSRLPMKSLHRIKTSCKLWYILCSQPYFVSLFNRISSQNPILLLDPSDSPLISVDAHLGVSELSLAFLKDRVRVRASSHGLLCCSSVPEKGLYYVCNPLTREFRVLPRSRDRPVTRFHPDGEATLVGLASYPGPARPRYKVVLAGYHRSFGRRPDGTFVSLVLDSETNKWSKLVSLRDHGEDEEEENRHKFSHMNKNQAVFVNGALHWLTSSGSILVLHLDPGCVWRRMGLPQETLCGGCRVYLLELSGFLSVVEVSESLMSIWVRREDWELVDRVSLRCIRGLVPGIFPICQTQESLLLATHRQVLVYHRKTRVWRQLYSANNNNNYSALPLWFSAHAFRTAIFSSST